MVSLMCSIITSATKFLAVLLCCTILSTLRWAQFVTDRLYNCTDSGGFDYLYPGQWVHNAIAVDQVISGRSMSEPDTIKAGWTMTGLWCLWCSFGVVSVLVSVILARIPWISTKEAGDICGYTTPPN